MTATALVLLINAFTSLLKKYVYPKFGSFGAQVVVFGLSVIGAVYYTYGQHIQSVANIVSIAIGLFSLSVAFYEVLLQHIPLFKVDSIDRG